MRGNHWFVRLGTGEIGPMSWSELQQLASQGVVKPDTAVSTDKTTWQDAADVNGLAVKAVGQQPPAIPAQWAQSGPGGSFCSRCGCPLAASVRFCCKCGSPVVGVSPSASPPPVPTHMGTRDQTTRPMVVYPRNPPLSPHLCWINWFFAVGLAQAVHGQVAKGIVMWLVMAVSSPLLPILVVVIIVSVIDAYMVGSTLRKGVPVGKWQFFPKT
jgi:hypothetical protein